MSLLLALMTQMMMVSGFTPLRIFNAQSNVAFSLIYAHSVGALNEKMFKTTTIIESNDISEFHYIFQNGTTLHYSLFVDSYLDNVWIFIIAHFFCSVLIMMFFSKTLYKNNTQMYITDSDVEGDGDEDWDGSTEDGSTEESDDEPDNSDEDANYEQLHFDALEELTDEALSPEDLKKAISGQYLSEDTPKGNVVLSYNVDAGSFEYYTDKYSDMSYEILDTVARLFTCKFNCKQICVNYRAEVENGKTKMLSEIEYDKLYKENKEKMMQEREKGSVFASFKSYNKKTGNNVHKKYFVITENANRFKYKGKLSDYQKLIDKPLADETASSKKISYADYKRSLTEDKCSLTEDKCISSGDVHLKRE